MAARGSPRPASPPLALRRSTAPCLLRALMRRRRRRPGALAPPPRPAPSPAPGPLLPASEVRSGGGGCSGGGGAEGGGSGAASIWCSRDGWRRREGSPHRVSDSAGAEGEARLDAAGGTDGQLLLEGAARWGGLAGPRGSARRCGEGCAGCFRWGVFPVRWTKGFLPSGKER